MGEIATANDLPSGSGLAPLVPPPVSQNLAHSDAPGAVMTHVEHEGTVSPTAEVLDEIERAADGGLADAPVFQPNEEVAAELALDVDDDALGGVHGSAMVVAEDEARDAPGEGDGISVAENDAQNEAENDTEDDAVAAYVPALGVTLAPLGRVEGGNGQGVVIVEMDRLGAASSEGLRAGNVILEVADEKVSHPSQVIAAVRSARDNGRRFILMRIKTANTIRLVQFPLEEA
jgi:serine protease Do